MLEEECRAAGVQILTNIKVETVEHGSEFTVRSADAVFAAPALVVATGGLSIPRMGATALGYELARQFGLAIMETRPALVPLIFKKNDSKRFCELAGYSAEVTVSISSH